MATAKSKPAAPDAGKSRTKSAAEAEKYAPSGKFNGVHARLAADVLNGRVDIQKANAARGCYSNILRMLDLRYRLARLAGNKPEMKRLAADL